MQRLHILSWRCGRQPAAPKSSGLAASKTGRSALAGSHRCREDAGERIALPLPAGLPLGYHRLELDAGRVRTQLSLIVAPSCCYLPGALGPGARSWGLTCQLYGLRSENNWGMGDFTDLARLADVAGDVRCNDARHQPPPCAVCRRAAGISAPTRRRAEPGSITFTSTRPTVPGFAEDETVRALMGGQWFGATRYAARSADLIDYGAVAACKRAVLEALFQRFRSVELAEGGAARGHLGRHSAIFSTAAVARSPTSRSSRRCMSITVVKREDSHGGTGRRRCANPTLGSKSPNSPPPIATVSNSFSSCNGKPTGSWPPPRRPAARRDCRSGSTGISPSAPIPNGAEAWADQELVAPGASIGAPPDALSRAGQNWGLAPINPLALRRQGFRAVHRLAAGQHAPCRDTADRSRHVA